MHIKDDEDKPTRCGAGWGRATRAGRAEAPRASLIAAARRLFTERGYDAVGTEEIVRAAGVTRGALYHHFGGKSGLLDAAYEQLEAESTERVARIVLGSDLHSPLEAMAAGIEAFLDECAEPELRQIALHDAPAVLGWDGGRGGSPRPAGESRWRPCCWGRSTRPRCWSPAPTIRPGEPR